MSKRIWIIIIPLFLFTYKGLNLNTHQKIETDEHVEFEANPLFDYVKNRFSIYNSEIDSSTINKFIEVSTEFGFINNSELFDLCIAQICLESSARQRKSDGTLVVSSGNAIGLGQIVPTTGFLYIKNIISKNDTSLFKLGGSNYDHMKKFKFCRGKSRKHIKTWLSNSTNNLIMWGYIMNDILKNNGDDLNKALMIYNQGPSYVKRYIKSKKLISKFEYVKRIRDIDKQFKRID